MNETGEVNFPEWTATFKEIATALTRIADMLEKKAGREWLDRTLGR